MMAMESAEFSPSSTNVDWAAILAGAAMATAIGLILLTFGAALGLNVSSAFDADGPSRIAVVMAGGLWLLWVQLFSFYIAGYVAARLRGRVASLSEHETEVRDGLHGLLVWATGVIVAATIAFGGVAGAQAMGHGQGPIGSLARVITDQADRSAATEAAQARDDGRKTEVVTEDRERAELARKIAIISAFIGAASLLAGAAAAFFGAHSGGRHRDHNVVLRLFTAEKPRMTKP